MDQTSPRTTQTPEPAAQTPEPPLVIETASATTSPENSSSGPFAYIVFGVVMVLLALIVMGLSSCVSGLANLGASGWDSARTRVERIDAPDDPYYYFDLDSLGELPRDRTDFFSGLER